MNQESYDNFLLEHKQNKFRRGEEYKGLTKNILHICNDPECERTWKQMPKTVLCDDYYCPSCVLHHRNNIKRFNIKRLEYTKYIPNTFYVYKIFDPETKIYLIKFGRTQNEDANKRYSAKERNTYKMELIYSHRNKLILTTGIENYWKYYSKKHNLYVRFSISSFHGATECINDSKLDYLLDKTNQIIAKDSDDINDYKK